MVGPNDDKAGVEASLDVEYMTTLGAGVPTEFWSFAGRQPDAPENEPFLDWLYLLGNTTNPPLVFSTSYGEDETSVTLDYAERMNQEFQKNSLRGISFLFASGDSGVGAMQGTCEEFMPVWCMRMCNDIGSCDIVVCLNGVVLLSNWLVLLSFFCVLLLCRCTPRIPLTSLLVSSALHFLQA